MSVTQTVVVPASRRLTIDIPPEVPEGQVVLTFTPASVTAEKILRSRELELINRNAERLNIEAMDVLSFQSLDI
jgi:hypothetical protein